MPPARDATQQIILQKLDGTQVWLGEWSAEQLALFLATGHLDFPAGGPPDPQNPPGGRIRLRFNGTSFELVDSVGSATPIGISTFLGLTDTPGSYASQAGRAPVVNTGEDALEFVPIGAGGGGDALNNEWLLGSPLSYASEVQFAANVVEYNRVWLPAGVTVTRGQFETTSISGGNAAVRIGLYSQTDPQEANYFAAGGQPNTRVAQSNISNVGAGAFTFLYTAGYLVPVSGYYWAAIVRGTGGGQKRFRSTGGLNRFVTPRWNDATAATALPATATPNTPTNNTPAVLVTTKVV